LFYTLENLPIIPPTVSKHRRKLSKHQCYEDRKIPWENPAAAATTATTTVTVFTTVLVANG